MANYLFTLAIFSCILLSVSSLTVDLFHRDSPRSPFHNRSLSEYDLVNNAVKRSINPKYSSPTVGDQLMKISVGTPAKPFTVVVDIQKMYTWIQCKPCDRCYKQKDPLFNPSQSSTYKTVACSTKTCVSVYVRGCDVPRLVCTYELYYGDGSQTRGDYATDTLVIGSARKSNMLFGCSHRSYNNGFFRDAAGVVGLGPGSNILNINNNGPNFNGKLSYCIAPSGASGKISFGTKVFGIGTVTTKLYHDSSYRVTLENIKVGDVTLAYPNKSVTLDTASLVTKLPAVFFIQLRAELVKAINGTPREDPSGLYPLCYGDNIKLPTLTIGFSGAELQLHPSNIFVKISSYMKCLAIFPSDDESAHLGYLFQTNFLIGFDSRRGQVSFKPTDCSKL